MNWVDLILRSGQSIEYASVAMDANNKNDNVIRFSAERIRNGRNRMSVQPFECHNRIEKWSQNKCHNTWTSSEGEKKRIKLVMDRRSIRSGDCVYCVGKSRVKPICQRKSKTTTNVLSCLLCVHEAKRKSNSNKVSLTISSMYIRFRSFSHDLFLSLLRIRFV